ncbi:MAG: response regulator transcription factor [Ferruginibacter sp.]
MIKHVLLVDDHMIIRTGLKILLKTDFPGCTFHEAEDGKTTLEMFKKQNFSLVILDVNIPGTNVFELVTKLLSLCPQLPILMFSMNDENVYAKKFYKLGVKGYVKKDEPADEIKLAVQTVLNNRKYISKSYSESLADQMFDKKVENPLELLSPKQVQITNLLIQGKTVSEICTAMKLHSSTVSTQKTRIFEKFKVSNVVELYAFAKMNNFTTA